MSQTQMHVWERYSRLRLLHLCSFLLLLLSTWGLLRKLEAAKRQSFVGTICSLVRPYLLLHHALVSGMPFIAVCEKA